MRIVVMGAGGVGGYFGGMLAAAGHDVGFVARGAHLAAMQRGGLRLTGPKGDVHVPAVRASAEAATLGPADIVLFCVKLYDTESAAAAIRPAMTDTTRLITLQNGVDGPERLAQVLGAERVLGGAAMVSAVIAEPGVIRYVSAMGRIVFGRLDGRADAIAEAFRERCNASGFVAEIPADITLQLWSKMVLLATNAGMSASTRQPIRRTYDDPEMRQVAIAALREGERVARALGVKLADDIVDKCVAQSSGFPPDMYASMYHDLKRGGRLEVDSLSGLIVRLGSQHGIPTPVHQALHAVLKPYQDGVPAP